MCDIKYKSLLLVLMVFAFPGSAQAGLINDKVKITSSFDYFLVMNADDKFEDDLTKALNFMTLSGSVEAKDGYGGRLGLRYAIPQIINAELGFSVGYVKGPRIDQDFNFGTTSEHIETRSRYFRFLPEASYLLPVTEKVKFRLASGVGVANGRMSVKTATQGLIPSDIEFERSHSTTGFTWEVSPSFVINFDKVAAEVGARYAYFPTIEVPIEENNTRTKIEWSSIGFFLGIDF